MRRPNQTHFPISLAGFLSGLLFLAGLQTSCSRHDSTSPATNTTPTNAAVVTKVLVITNVVVVTNLQAATAATNAPADTNASTKGIARVEEVKAPKTDITPPYHRVFVLCVGINSNPAYGNLKYAVGDATAVADTLRGVYGFTNVTLLTNSFATKAGVLAALDDISGRLSTNLDDDFIFYFSGHGDTCPVPNVQNGKTNYVRNGFLVAYDEATNIPANGDLEEMRKRNLELSSLAQKIVGLPARHRLIFLDSCFSGLAFLNEDVVDKRPDDFNADVIKHRTVSIMTAGLASEQAVEDSQVAHGIFTAALLKQLNGDNILTMEELFYPMRVTMRTSLLHVPGDHVMTPQLRYLVYDNGSFLFVPQDQLAVWANEKPDNTALAEADTKGFLRPVTINDVTNLQSAATGTPEQKQALVDRYEARAAVGDPLATIALAQIYKQGIGVQANPDRARIYTAESSDFMTAATTMNIAALAGITNQAIQEMFGGLVKGYEIAALLGGKQNNAATTIVAAEEGAKLAKPVFSSIGKWASGVFNRSPIKRLVSMQKKVKSLLAEPTAKNITSAKKELVNSEDDLAKLVTLWPADQQPAEVTQLKQFVQQAESALDQNAPAQAADSMDKAGTAIDAIQNLIKSQTAAAKKS